jgi:hypothetical protein
MLALIIHSGVVMLKFSVVVIPFKLNVTMYDPSHRSVAVAKPEGITEGRVAISCQMIDIVSTLVASNVAVPVQLNQSVGVVETKF